ncbi:MAG: lytic transglycosylase domain-containing protein [Flavobacteriales bacterium]|nr:lytic transglycosylase domain-containing protein [Flavobacteriales bacterium]
MKNALQHLARTLGLLVLLLAGSIAAHLLVFSASSAATDLDHRQRFNDGYKVFSLTLPAQVSFCGEPVPMDRIDVRERLDRELLVNTYWQSNTLLAHKRANRWFPLIEEVLRREGVPDDMKYLALVESNFTNAVSPMGAAGYWQFMKETGQAQGLEVNAEVDERYNVEKSTVAACKYLKASYAKYGSWALAAASYNLGQGGVDKQLGRQNMENYFDLLLPEETSRYVFRILAMKEIISEPERYGFHIRAQDLYPPYRTQSVEVKGPIEDLAAFALRHSTDYKTVKLLNPWLRDSKLTNKEGRTYAILLPAEGFHDGATE